MVCIVTTYFFRPRWVKAGKLRHHPFELTTYWPKNRLREFICWYPDILPYMRGACPLSVHSFQRLVMWHISLRHAHIGTKFDMLQLWNTIDIDQSYSMKDTFNAKSPLPYRQYGNNFHNLMWKFWIHSPHFSLYMIQLQFHVWFKLGPNWVLSAPDGPHVDPMNLATRVSLRE